MHSNVIILNVYLNKCLIKIISYFRLSKSFYNGYKKALFEIKTKKIFSGFVLYDYNNKSLLFISKKLLPHLLFYLFIFIIVNV